MAKNVDLHKGRNRYWEYGEKVRVDVTRERT